MVKLDTNFENQTNSSPSLSESQTNEQKSGLVKTIGQCLSFAPFVFEQFTGQKVPQMTGTMAEMNLALQQIYSNLQVMANNQNQLVQRITNLETIASQQFNNLNQQLVTANQSFRLLATETKRSLEFNPRPENEENY